MSRIKRYNSTTQQWEYADLALQDDGSKESKSNKLLSVSGGGAGITSSATDTQYPSAKAVYDVVGDVEAALSSINTALAGLIGGNS